MGERIPYNQSLTHKHIKPIRHSRNLTLVEFSKYMGVAPETINRLENEHLEFTSYYEEKLREAIKKLRITNVELVSIRTLITEKERRKIK